MEQSNQTHEIDQLEDSFFDALDYFPFRPGSVSDESIHPTSDSTPGESSSSVSSPATAFSPTRCGYSNPESSCISSDTIQSYNFNTRYEELYNKFYRDLKENEKNLEDSVLTWENLDRLDSAGDTNRVNEDDKQMVSITDDGKVSDSDGVADEFGDSPYMNLFVFIAGLVVKAIGFKVNLFFSLVMIPIWGLYNSYMLVVDPFGVIRRGRGFFLKQLGFLWDLSGGSISPLVFDQQSVWKLLLRFGYAMFWCSYVCAVLCGLLVFSTLTSGVAMRFLVENPIEMKHELIFDYTQKSPAAFVPIISCGGVGCSLNCEEKSLGPRVVPLYHKLQVNLQLTLPESTYNKNLGVFQVRIDLLSPDGKVIASKRQPCMLKFKSELVQTVNTFFKIAPLLTGYLSETQTLKVNIRGITEGDVPTSCIKVVLEQRAEYQPGAGIPEIYDASLSLESELPFMKRMIWGWRKTMFVWISMMLFIVKLLFALICCRSLIMPRTRSRTRTRTRQRDVPSATNSTLQNLTKLVDDSVLVDDIDTSKR
ncbi:seipin-2 [Euphorbia lathyris]|uniref:seipin-2 n=1 Tax=Euphorbia lathyris TaxID=212925 RepID=UPI00331435D3